MRQLTDVELLARQDALQAEPRAFVARHRLGAVLAPLGRVIPVGSAVTGLMVWRDLDVTVDAPDVEPAAVWDAVRPLLHRCDARAYADETGARAEPGSFERHYFVFRLERWKLDVSAWTNGAPEAVERFQRELPARLDRRTRLDILRLEELWHARPEFPELVGGHDICSAVLEHGVRTPAEPDAYLERRGPGASA